MTLPKLTAHMAMKARISKRAARAALNAFLNAVVEDTAAGGTVMFRGFGTFRVVDRAPRKGRDHSTGQPVPIPARRVLSFRPSEELRDKLRVIGIRNSLKPKGTQGTGDG